MSLPKESAVFDSYWKFAASRQQAFMKRLRGEKQPWSDDPILQQFKFTNCYRIADRVSQYLLNEVIYNDEWSIPDLFFRIMLFKFFNKIETWELLQKTGTIYYGRLNLEKYDAVLSQAMQAGERIYSAAYIMPACSQYSTGRKHTSHLKLLEAMMNDDLPHRIASTPTMEKAFKLLQSYPMMGDFLAYQYVTDLNYSTLTNFDEMEFVVAGPGALDGIAKCFSSIGSYSESDIIKEMTRCQDYEFSRLGLSFEPLLGRKLQLIDCQNLFCEFSKYSRQAHPEVVGTNGRTKIKQLFKPQNEMYKVTLPSKWLKK